MSPATAAASPSIPGWALALRLLRGQPTEHAMRAAGFSDIEEMLLTIGSHFKVPRMELDSLELPPALAQLLTRALAEKHRIVPVFSTDNEVTIATADPTRIEIFDWLARAMRRAVVTVISTPEEIDRAIRRLYDVAVIKAVVDADDDAPAKDVSQEALAAVTPIVDRVIETAVEMKASDIHIEATERETLIRFRVDGVLRIFETRPQALHSAIVSRLKILASLDISIRHTPQDGRIKLKRARGDVDLRVSVLPTYYGEKVVCRVLDNTKAALPLAALGFEPEQLAIFERMIRIPYGLLLVTGPTGSGKSTTLYGALNAVRNPELNIVTVEDPVEYQLPGINQVQVNVKRGLTFPNALRSILRQDPNVILIGEIRDHESGVIAAESALTGHLVLSSLHTNDAPTSITRLTEMGIEPYLVAPSLIGVVAQRLLRKVCPDCAEDVTPSEDHRAALDVPRIPDGVRFRRGRGCKACHKSGYSGRTAIRELLEIDPRTRALIARGETADNIRAEACSRGFKTMRWHALRLLFQGVTTFEEVIRVTRS